MSEPRKVIRVRDVMKVGVDMVDGLTTVADALRMMKYVDTNTLIVDKRDDDDEYGIVLLMLVEEHRSRRILERIAEVGGFDSSPGTGIAFQIDVEDAVGVRHQMRTLSKQVEEEL